MPNGLTNLRIAILATDGFEESELTVPRDRLREAGAEVDVVSLKSGAIKGWDRTDWGGSVEVDRALEDADADSYDAIVLPGGVINPDTLRQKPEALDLIRRIAEANKPVAAICHAGWLLIETGLADGLKATSYYSIRTDMENAGVDWRDEAVVQDDNIITSRHPGDLDAFCEALTGALEQRVAKGLAPAAA